VNAAAALRRALQAASRALPWALAALAVASATYYVLHHATPHVIEDGWYFVEAWLVPWQDGTFTPADLWAKRPANHAQPLAALLFLANARWFGLDFSAEAAIGLALAFGYGLALLALARRAAPARPPLAFAWFAGVVFCVLFSLNASGKLTWSLVGLFYLGHLGGLALLAWVAARRRAPSPPALFGAALAMAGLFDTSGVLWCLAAAAMLLLTRSEGAPVPRGRALRGALAIGAALLAYRLLFAWLAPPMDGEPLPSLALSLAGLWQRSADAWQVLLPFGAALAHPYRLQQLYGEGDYTAWVLLLALPCLAAHAALWWVALRRPVGHGYAVACGLALFAYATLAGIVLQRVPAFGFDYLLQPRYGVFYDLFWLAPLLAWYCRPISWPAPPAGPALAARRGAIALYCLLPCAAMPLWWQPAWFEQPWVRGWNDAIARDTWRLLRDPERVPADCHPYVLPCRYPAATRRRVIEALRAGPYNVADPHYRTRHGLDALLREVDAADAEREKGDAGT
jgi:hypothetical protein